MTPSGGSSFVDVRETHVAAVVLFGDLAVKIKKPIRTAFLDFSTGERRLAACRRELELNRRLAPDVYLGVVDLPGPDGAPGDHAIVMRRMPDERRLSHLLEVGAPVSDAIERLAVLIADSHRSARRGPEVTAEGGQQAIRDRWESNLREIWRYSDSVLDPVTLADIELRAREFVDGRGSLFARRQRDGRIVDGHGDLLADDIFCLDDGPRVLDCLEFDDRLRYVDGLDDAAFLAMDLEYHGRADVAETFLNRYVELAADPAPAALRHHYIAYRALVRAKVACLRHDQGDAGSGGTARRYLELAHRHLRDGTPRLVLIGGAPGTGKSTIAGALAEKTGATLIASDSVRKALHGLAATTPAPARLREGIYDQRSTDDTYAELLRRAEHALRHGESVILDASWTASAHRRAAADLAQDLFATLVPVRCTAPDHVIEQRLRLRVRTESVSDADVTIGRALTASAEPWPTAFELNTDQPVATAVEAVLADMGHEPRPGCPLAS